MKHAENLNLLQGPLTRMQQAVTSSPRSTTCCPSQDEKGSYLIQESSSKGNFRHLPQLPTLQFVVIFYLQCSEVHNLILILKSLILLKWFVIFIMLCFAEK